MKYDITWREAHGTTIEADNKIEAEHKYNEMVKSGELGKIDTYLGNSTDIEIEGVGK